MSAHKFVTMLDYIINGFKDTISYGDNRVFGPSSGF